MAIHPTLSAFIHYIGLPVTGNPAYLSTVLFPFSPSILDDVQRYFTFPLLGRYP